MTYNKPSIELLDEAVRAIQGPKPNASVSDTSSPFGDILASYELDE